METTAIVVQLLLALAAFWYTIETRKLRKQNESQVSGMLEQLELLRTQTQVLLKNNGPYFLLGFLSADKVTERRKAGGNADLEKQAARRDQRKEKCRAFVSMKNLNENLAISVNCDFYDRESDGIYETFESFEVIEGKEERYLGVGETRYTLDEYLTRLSAQYTFSREQLSKLLRFDDSAIICIYTDAYGRVLLQTRQFRTEEDGGASYGSSYVGELR